MEKKIVVILFCGNLFLQIVKKKKRKNLVPHGNQNPKSMTGRVFNFKK